MKNAGMVSLGIVVGAVAAFLTEIPTAAVFVIAFAAFAVQKYAEP
jgi:hypothetical protein